MADPSMIFVCLVFWFYPWSDAPVLLAVLIVLYVLFGTVIGWALYRTLAERAKRAL